MSEDKPKRKQAKPEAETPARALRAKKDHTIIHNDFRRHIKAGDDLSDIPDIYLENLKTENVI